jgi:dihydrofolate synthase/folylpolyglutamate synthase
LTYTQAVEFLFSRRQKNMKLGLDRMENLLHRLDRPEKRFKSIHIAGTNGKGSTAAMTASILQAAGHKIGLYTSPHLIDMRERIQIDGVMISEERVLNILDHIKPDIEATDASFFEVMTAMAFVYFAESRVDIAVVETGLGGRLDATNTMTPIITIITEIGLDHTKILGKTLRPIAREKAGILKSGVPCIIGSKNASVNSFFQTCTDQMGCTARFSKESTQLHRVRLTETGTWTDITVHGMRYDQLYLRLAGEHQIWNMATALICIDLLRDLGWHISEHAVREGLNRVRWPARLDLLQTHPKILLDSAHNPLGARRLSQALRMIFQYHRLILIFGVLEDKNYQAMLDRLIPLAGQVILTQPLSDRALHPEKLGRSIRFQGIKHAIEPDIGNAWRLALDRAEPEDMICGTGSIYFVGELLRLWRAANPAL